MNELTWLVYSLVIAAALPYVAKAPLGFAMHKIGTIHRPGYDNKYPRAQQKRLDGFGARCLAAHENCFEALIIFAPAVLLAIVTDNITRNVAILAVAFVFFRTLYLIFYWANWDRLRSTVWFLGIASSFGIMLSCVP
jgi:uncharacterized MAPEG superfamily protein